MKAGHYVGRIGELAAILGVGAVLSLAAPAAWADEESADSDGARRDTTSATSDSVDQDSEQDESERTPTTKSGKDTEPDSADSDDDAGTETVDIESAATADEARPEDAPEDPEDDVNPPIDWVVAAAARRELGVDPAPAEVENHPPSITDVNVGPASSGTGSVRGKVVADDGDGDSLRFAATTTANGTVSMNSFTGTFRYRPTAAARHAAAAVTHPVTQDTIVVTVDDRNGGIVSQTVTVPIAPRNRVPILFTSTRSPDSSTGTVIGRLSAIDFDRDILEYRAPTTTSKGSITFDPASRTIVYTPTEEARRQAGAPGAPASAKKDTFTVTISDGHGGVTTKTVTVRISPTAGPVARTGVSMVGQVTVPGYAEVHGYSAAGTHSVIVSDATDFDSFVTTTKVIVVDNATARQVGGTLTLAGIPSGPPSFNASRTRAVVQTHIGGEVRIAMINATTGTQIGSTLLYTGDPPSLSPFGDRVAITSATAGSSGVSVRIIDTSTGAQIGPTAALDLPASAPRKITWNPAGTRVLVAAQAGDWDAGFTTYAQVIDASTGAANADVLEIEGGWSSGPLFNAAGTQALVITAGFDSADLAVTRVAGIDMTTGERIGATVTMSGALDSVLQTADGDRAIIIVRPDSRAPQPNSSSLAVINIATGSRIGTTVTLSGTASAAALNAPTTRAIVTHEDFPGGKTAVTVIDTATGVQVGSTVILNGRLVGTVSNFVTVDGAYALVATNTGDAAIVNTLTGARTFLAVPGEVRNFQLSSADGGRAVITTRDEVNDSVSVVVVNMATGVQIGNTVRVDGDTYAPLLLSTDRALITTYDKDIWTGAERTRIVSIDTGTGKAVSSTLTMTGALYGKQLLSPTGSRALLTVSVWNPLTYSGTTKLCVFDVTTGKQVGTAISVSGEVSVPPTFSPDGSRVVLTTANPVPFTGKSTGRVVVLRVI